METVLFILYFSLLFYVACCYCSSSSSLKVKLHYVLNKFIYLAALFVFKVTSSCVCVCLHFSDAICFPISQIERSFFHVLIRIEKALFKFSCNFKMVNRYYCRFYELIDHSVFFLYFFGKTSIVKEK